MDQEMKKRLHRAFKEGFTETARGWAGEYNTSQAHLEELTDEFSSDLAGEAVQILEDSGVTVS